MVSISRWGARALAVTASVALLPALLPAGSASAGELRYRDATGDVQKFDLTDDETLTPVADRHATNGDIKNVFIHYRTGRLVIRANYVDLRPRRDTTLTFTGEIKTNEKRRWLYNVDTSPGKYAGHDQLRTYRGFGRACEIGHTFDYRKNFTRVVVPLKCLSNPRWVRVSVGAVTLQMSEKALKEFFTDINDGDPTDLSAGDVVIRADDSGRPNVVDTLRWTPRIYR
jgi:hypothetical protein